MEGFRRASQERVNAFEVDDVYLFKHYFEGEHVFDRLKKFYNNQQYRFEVPAPAFETIQEFLADNGYGLVVVESTAPFVVVVEKYTAHPENIFKASVIQRSVDGYNCFLLTDESSVERAVDGGAVRIEETGLDNPF